jgi:hypothetical protein
MSYREDQRGKVVKLRDDLFKDPGDGLFFNKQRDFVLHDPALNLWAGIRDDALDYFKANQISWWMSNDQEPTGHLLSSQVACINHLYYLRQRKDLATALLKNVDSRILSAECLDNGFVEFEVIGKQNYLNEKSHTRGANSTSVDAMMVGKKSSGKDVLFLIEWKYTESYGSESKYIPERYNNYNPLLGEKDTPIKTADYESLYYEPYYQLMRQTLLGWKMAQVDEYGCDEYIHVHIIPEKNLELRDKVTSPKLSGANMSDAWKTVLADPAKYKVISPEDLLKPLSKEPDSKSLLQYLKIRYWD